MGYKRKRENHAPTAEGIIRKVIQDTLKRISDEEQKELKEFKFLVHLTKESEIEWNKTIVGSTIYTCDVLIRLYHRKILSIHATTMQELAEFILSRIDRSNFNDSEYEIVHIDIEMETYRLVFYTKQLPNIKQDIKVDLDIIHQDEAIVVVNKPFGLASVDGNDNPTSLHRILLSKYPHARIVHRLDMETSGVMVVALTVDAAKFLNSQFRERTTSKRYEAIVEGIMIEKNGIVDLPLAADPTHRIKQHVDLKNGKKCKSIYETISYDGLNTRVALNPETGRTHQLRVHMQSLGHSIVGDSLYSSDPNGKRLHLHATSLSFLHPQTGESMTFLSPSPF